jgi:site-specific recombinase XerC
MIMISYSKDGCRDRAMLSIGWRLGPRVSEVAGLSMKSISLVSGSPEPEYEIMIIGKGNKQRPAKLVLDLNAAIYLREGLEIRGTVPGTLFFYITRGDHLRRLDRHLSPRALHLILKNRIADANRAAEVIKPLTWHDFRRTVISDIIADSKQGSLVEAQKIAGHSSVITTSNTIACGEKRLTLPSNLARTFPTMFAAPPKEKVLRLSRMKGEVSK